jgi:hypothetical protein
MTFRSNTAGIMYVMGATNSTSFKVTSFETKFAPRPGPKTWLDLYGENIEDLDAFLYSPYDISGVFYSTAGTNTFTCQIYSSPIT